MKLALCLELMCLGIMSYMWFSLAHDVESGKPFKLNNSWYEAHKVLVIKP